MSKSWKVIVIGAGSRGKTYATHMGQQNGAFEVVAIAEPITSRRNYIKDMWQIPEENCSESWEEFLDRPKFADLVVIATQDQEHFAPAMKAIEKGYNLLLEKPMASTPEECVQIQKAAEKKGVFVLVCHVLRFTPFFRGLKKLISDGLVGDVVHIQHAECVGNVHQSHSYVRGNWRNSETSTPMIVAKSCHDMDILQFLTGKQCKRVQSFGSLYYFNREHAPEGSPEYCIDGCPVGDTCPYNAVKLYLDDKKNTWFRPAAVRCATNPTDREVEKVLRTTSYGKCVFKCDNNVVDHQTVNMEFEDGVTASFTMCAFTKGARRIRIMGTKGELSGNLGEPTVTLYDFETKTTREINVTEAAQDQSIVGGHGGGDGGIIRALSRWLQGDFSDKSICTIAETTENHLIAYAAEESRIKGTVIDMDEYNKRIEQSI